MVFALLTMLFTVGSAQQVDVTFLGCYDSYGMLKESSGYTQLCQQHPQLNDISRYLVDTGGKEVFLIVPRDKDADIVIREATAPGESSSASAKELYRSDSTQPFLISCNDSHSFCDVTIRVTTYGEKDDIVTEFMPLAPDTQVKTLDMKNFTMGDAPLGISVMLKNGRVSACYDKQTINNWLTSQSCVADGWVSLQGINGVVKDIYVADIGQDTNPVLGILMSDGTVRMYRLFDGIKGEYYVSAQLPNMKDIVGFTDVANDKEERDYVTFFAVDSKGKQYEMETFFPCGNIDYDVTGDYPYSHCTISLGNSGNMKFVATPVNGQPAVVRSGTYTVTLIADGKGIDTYRVDYHLTRVLKNDRSAYSVLNGSFTMTYDFAHGTATAVKPIRGNELGIGIGQSRTVKLTPDALY